jgi:uncharacterized RDD family membrane protein YckC
MVTSTRGNRAGIASAMATAATNRNVQTAAVARPLVRDEPLDTKVRLVTPERIVFQYPLAGPFRRFCAYLVDLGLWLLLVIVALMLSVLLSLGSAAGLGLFFVAYFVLTWGYGAACEGLFNGRTLGKRVLGIRVVSDRGVPINGAQAVLRNLVGVVDGLPFFFLPGLSSMILTRKFQRLGDLAAGTMVVSEARRRRVGRARGGGPGVESVLPWLPVRVAAGPDLTRALSDYVRFRGRVAPGRREEMAAHLAGPLRLRHGLPQEASNDAVLCAVYHRVFLGE